MHDESLWGIQHQSWKRQFWAGPKEQFEVEGQKAIHVRIKALFSEVKKQYKNIFRGNEEITLSNQALAFIASELAKYDFTHTDVDARDVVYQELVGVNLRGDRGQYSIPRGVVKLVVEMPDPKKSELVLDPACGIGGFLVATLGHTLKKFREEQNTQSGSEDTAKLLNVHERLKEFATTNVLGTDFDPFLIRTAQMNMVLAGDGRGHIYNINSLESPLGHLIDLLSVKREIPLGSVGIIATNPPFGFDIPITDKHIPEQYELAHSRESGDEGNFCNTGSLKGSVVPEVLFIERCVKWLKPGTGCMGIVLPDDVLNNPAAEYIRWWIMREIRVLASANLSVETLIVEANANILTSLLFPRRKSDKEKHAEALGDINEYLVSMAVADKAGFDRRDNRLYKRTPGGEEIVEPKQHIERIRIGGRFVERTPTRSEKIEDNDLLIIADKYHEFLKVQGQ